MFSVGEYIVYGGEGVCKVEDIGTPDIFDDGETRVYYTLAPLYRQGLIYTPVDTKIGMRKVISHDEAVALIREMPEIKGEVYENRNVRVLTEYYQEQMSSHECLDLIRIIKAISAKRELMTERGKKLGQIDEKFFRKAEDLLYGEFAVALAVPKEDVKEIIIREIQELQ